MVVILISLFVSVVLIDNEEDICDFLHSLETMKSLVKLETFLGWADPKRHAQPSVPSPCCLESRQLTRSVIQLNMDEPILVSFGKHSRLVQLWLDVVNNLQGIMSPFQSLVEALWVNSHSSLPARPLSCNHA